MNRLMKPGVRERETLLTSGLLATLGVESVAAMMEMRLKRAFPAIAIGVVIAGVIVSVVTYGAQAIFSC